MTISNAICTSIETTSVVDVELDHDDIHREITQAWSATRTSCVVTWLAGAPRSSKCVNGQCSSTEGRRLAVEVFFCRSNPQPLSPVIPLEEHDAARSRKTRTGISQEKINDNSKAR